MILISKCSMTAAMFGAVCLCGSIGAAAASGEVAVKEVRSTWITVDDHPEALESLETTAPADGTMLVTAAGSVNYESTNGTVGNYCLTLAQAPRNVEACEPAGSTNVAVRNYIAADFPTTESGVGMLQSYTLVRTWSVQAGHSYSFYVNGYQGGMTVSLFQPSITALFVPGKLP